MLQISYTQVTATVKSVTSNEFQFCVYCIDEENPEFAVSSINCPLSPGSCFESIMDSVSITEWPLFVWKFKDFLTICQEMKTNCSVQGRNFNLILEQKTTTSPNEEQFKLDIEELPQKPSKDAVISLNFYVRSYIIDKSQKQQFLKTVEVTFEGKGKRQYIWGARKEKLSAKYSTMKQENGEMWLICVFEPKSELELCQPKSTLDSAPWVSLEALSRDFDLLRGTSGDLRLVFGGKEMYVHRNIILARCPKLVQAIEDAEKSNTKFSDLDETNFGYFMKYVYSGCLPDITVAAARTLYEFASKYEVDDLMELCATMMTSNLNEMNVYDLLLLAHQYKHEGFKKSITDYILLANILKSKNWISFSDQHMELGLEVYQAHAESH